MVCNLNNASCWWFDMLITSNTDWDLLTLFVNWDYEFEGTKRVQNRDLLPITWKCFINFFYFLYVWVMGSDSHNTWHLEGVEMCLMWLLITAITNAEQYNNKNCGDIEMFTVQSVANDKDCIRLARSWLLVLTIGWRSRLQLLLEKYTRRNITSTE